MYVNRLSGSAFPGTLSTFEVYFTIPSQFMYVPLLSTYKQLGNIIFAYCMPISAWCPWYIIKQFFFSFYFKFSSKSDPNKYINFGKLSQDQ